LTDDSAHQYPDAGNILKVLSFFDPESITLELLTQGAELLSQSPSIISPSGIAAALRKVSSLLQKRKKKVQEIYGDSKLRALQT
jgi:hypothetical protein